MATESVATRPDRYGADPVHGNFTDESHMHLWCAQALAIVLTTPERPVDELNDDIQEALRSLLASEISRAKQAAKAESDRLIPVTVTGA